MLTKNILDFLNLYYNEKSFVLEVVPMSNHHVLFMSYGRL
jgi:hypothetical protein